MRGLIWATAVWVVFFLVARRFRHRSAVVEDWFGREQLALVIALLGAFAIASSSETQEILRQPLVIERIVRGGLAVLALLVAGPVLYGRMRSYTPGRRAMTGLLAYMMVALISTIFSAAPLVTAAKVGELTAGLVPILAIALGPRPGERLRNTVTLVIGLAGALLTAAAVGVVALPSTFRYLESRPGFVMAETMAAPYAHNNTLAALGGVVAVFAIAKLLTSSDSRWLWVGASVVGVANVVLAAGRQGVVMFLVGLAVVLWSTRRALLLGLVVPVAFGVWDRYSDVLFGAFARDRPADRLTTLSGRVYWWDVAVEAWRVHPWTGWGYGAGGRFVALASIGRTTSSVHSGFVEALVGVGILGLVGLVYALIEVIVWSVRNLRLETALATLIVPLTLRTAMSQGFAGWLNIEFVLFALLVAIADQSRIERRARQAVARSSLADPTAGI